MDHKCRLRILKVENAHSSALPGGATMTVALLLIKIVTTASILSQGGDGSSFRSCLRSPCTAICCRDPHYSLRTEKICILHLLAKKVLPTADEILRGQEQRYGPSMHGQVVVLAKPWPLQSNSTTAGWPHLMGWKPTLYSSLPMGTPIGTIHSDLEALKIRSICAVCARSRRASDRTAQVAG